MIGDGLWYVAFPLLVLMLTTSPIIFGATMALEGIADFATSILSGTFVDRVDKRRILLCSAWAGGLAAAIIGCSFSMGVAQLPIVILAVAVLHSSAAIYQVAFAALLPQVVSRTRLLRVNAALGGVEGLSSIVAPLCGGALFALVGPYIIALLDAVSFISLALSGQKIPSLANGSAQRTESSSLRRGAAWIWGDGTVRLFLSTNVLSNCAIAIMETTMFLVLRETYGLQPFAIGAVVALQAVIASLVLVVLGQVWEPWRLRSTVVAPIAYTAQGVCLLAASTAHNVVVFVIALGLTSGAIAITATTIRSFRQAVMPAELSGSISAIARTISVAGLAPGSLIAGLLVANSRATSPLLVAACIVLSVAGVLGAGRIDRDRRDAVA